MQWQLVVFPAKRRLGPSTPAAELDDRRRRALELVRGEFEERTWQAFWQVVVEGRSPVDIAADLGVSPTAVRMAKSRILHRLKKAFGDLIQKERPSPRRPALSAVL